MEDDTDVCQDERVVGKVSLLLQSFIPDICQDERVVGKVSLLLQSFIPFGMLLPLNVSVLFLNINSLPCNFRQSPASVLQGPGESSGNTTTTSSTTMSPLCLGAPTPAQHISTNVSTPRPLPPCPHYVWALPHPLNTSAPTWVHHVLYHHVPTMSGRSHTRSTHQHQREYTTSSTTMSPLCLGAPTPAQHISTDASIPCPLPPCPHYVWALPHPLNTSALTRVYHVLYHHVPTMSGHSHTRSTHQHRREYAMSSTTMSPLCLGTPTPAQHFSTDASIPRPLPPCPHYVWVLPHPLTHQHQREYTTSSTTMSPLCLGPPTPAQHISTDASMPWPICHDLYYVHTTNMNISIPCPMLPCHKQYHLCDTLFISVNDVYDLLFLITSNCNQSRGYR